jgi:hypothetical protein
MSLLTSQASNTRKIIVTCPSCSTKFALPSSIAEEKDQIRFHCSRCDRQFSLTTSELDFETKPLQKKSQSDPEQDIKPSGLKREPFTMGWQGEAQKEQSEPISSLVSKPFRQPSELMAKKERSQEFSTAENTEQGSETLELVSPFIKEKKPKHPGTFLTLLSPLALLMILLASLSLALSLGYARESFAAFNSSLRAVAPAGLALKDVKHNLDEATEVLVVSGKVRNFEDRAVKKIEVEAVFFDLGNNQIAASRLNKDRFSLRPGEEREFNLILNQNQAREAAYYSVRIHSVEK